MRYESFLEQVELLKELSSYERATIADSLAPRKYAEGETVIRQGEIGNEIFFLLSGTAEAFVDSEDGQKSVPHNYVARTMPCGSLARTRTRPSVQRMARLWSSGPL